MKFYFLSSFLILYSLAGVSQTRMEINVRKITLKDQVSDAYVHWVFKDSTEKGRLMVYTFPENSNDSIVIFESNTINLILTGPAYWRDKKGRLLKKANFLSDYHEKKSPQELPANLPLFGILDGEMIVWHPSDLKDGNLKYERIEHYSKGIKHGKQEYFTSEGILYAIENYNEGKPDGEMIFRYSNGVLSDKKFYKDGFAHGWWFSYHADGSLKTKQHYNFSVADTVLNYFPGGILKEIYYHYDKNSWLPAVEYDSLGKLKRFRSFDREGRQHGIYYGYHSNGQKSFEGYFEKGLQQGKWYEWHENGKLKLKGSYKNNFPFGKWGYYNSYGKLIKVENHSEKHEEPIAPPPVIEELVEVEDEVFVAVTQEPEFMGGHLQYVSSKLKFSSKIYLVRVSVTSYKDGNAEFKIRTPMNEKDKARLIEYLKAEHSKMKPLKLNGKPYKTELETVFVFSY